MSTEEFFMYLTIGLIVVIPVSVRVYRYLTAKQAKRVIQQLSESSATKASDEPR